MAKINENLRKEISEYDFVRFVFVDIHGISRCKYVPKRHVQRFIDTGLGIFSGTILPGPRSQLILTPEIKASRLGNGYLKPVDGAHPFPIPWACQGKYRVAELLCETYWADGSIQAANTRYVARKQLQSLADLGYTLLSSYEHEFFVLHENTLKPIFNGRDVCATLLHNANETFFSDLDSKLFDSKIDAENYHTEYAPGQFEIVLMPKRGIDAADQGFRLKEALKEIGQQTGYCVSSMAKLDEECGNGLHFNHSLWNAAGNENAFYDTTKQNRLSEVARWWIAGLLKHSRAIAALCCPTVNCYRRIHIRKLATPSAINYGIEDRWACYRIKNESASATYIESRLPSGSANHYLVLAATVAAGVDGIRNRLIPPPPGTEEESLKDCPELPRTLAEALQALEADDVMVDALGKEFVNWFLTEKRTVELEELKESRVDDMNDVAGFLKEREMYLKFF